MTDSDNKEQGELENPQLTKNKSTLQTKLISSLVIVLFFIALNNPIQGIVLILVVIGLFFANKKLNNNVDNKEQSGPSDE